MLDRNIIDMVILNIRGRFDLDKPPASVSTALEYIDSDEHVLVLKRALEYRVNLWIFD